MPDELACCRYMDQWDKVLVRALIKASGNTGRNTPLKQYAYSCGTVRHGSSRDGVGDGGR